MSGGLAPLLLQSSPFHLLPRQAILPSITQPSPTVGGTCMSRRQNVVKEIFDTEEAYILQMNTIVTLFLSPIREKGLLPSTVTNAIFSNLEGILSVNRELLHCMKQHSLGEAFNNLAPFLKLYSTYASNYEMATNTLQTWLKEDPEFSQFVTLQESRLECKGLRLQSLLITPVQRVPRYKLLLDDLLRHTKETHLEYSKLNGAAQQLEAVTSHINEQIRQQENSKRMLSIQNSLVGKFVTRILVPGRRFIREGILMKVCKRKSKKRAVFLFSDMLLYARTRSLARNMTFECRGVLPLLNSDIQLMLKDYRAPGVSALLRLISDEKTIILFSYKEEEVYEWTHLIEHTSKELRVAYKSLLTPRRQKKMSRRPPNLVISTSIMHTKPTSEGVYPLTPATPLSNLADPFSPCSSHEEGMQRHGHLLQPPGTHHFDPAYPPRSSLSHSRHHTHQDMHVFIQGEPSLREDDDDDDNDDDDQEETLPLITTDRELRKTEEGRGHSAEATNRNEAHSSQSDHGSIVQSGRAQSGCCQIL